MATYHSKIVIASKNTRQPIYQHPVGTSGLNSAGKAKANTVHVKTPKTLQSS